MPGFMRIKAKATRVRREPGEMNGLERKYAAHLEVRKLAGEIADWKFDSWKVRLLDDKCWLVVDFMVMLADGTIQFHECKGFMEGDAWLKLKMAAEFYWMFDFFLVKAKKKAEGGGWEIKKIGGEQ